MTKRVFDIIFALFLLSLLFWLIIFSWLVAAIDTRSSGIFIQERIGQFGNKFNIYKLRTIRDSSFAVEGAISKTGQFLRRYRIDEFPQLFNVVKGEMSFVGPRPDISGYYDLLEGENRKILELKPGLSSIAAIRYMREDVLLKRQPKPLEYNDTFIFPDKVKLNLAYYHKRSFWGDIEIIMKTIIVLLTKSK